jgi:phage terminase large subunit
VPGTEILIIAPNYSLSSISWDLQKQLISLFGIEVVRSNAKDKVIELQNGSIIRMGSVSQVDSVVGRSYDLIIFDEAALNDSGSEAFEIALRPTLDKTNSKAIFISTTRGKNWFHNYYQRGYSKKFPTWVSIRSTWKDNPRVDIKDIDDARNSMSAAKFSQEYECDFIALEGQIYYLDKEDIREVDTTNLDVDDIIAGMDVGFRDPTAFVVCVSDGHTYYIVDEYLGKEKSTSETSERVQGMLDKWNIDLIYIDSAAAQTKYDLAYDYEIDTVNAKKSVNDGIGYITSLLEHNRVVVHPDCKHVLACLDNYRWDSGATLIKERPKHDEYSHMADALRYALYSHSHNVDVLGEI